MLWIVLIEYKLWFTREPHIWDPIKSIKFGESWVCGLFLNENNDKFFVTCLGKALYSVYSIYWLDYTRLY